MAHETSPTPVALTMGTPVLTFAWCNAGGDPVKGIYLGPTADGSAYCVVPDTDGGGWSVVIRTDKEMRAVPTHEQIELAALRRENIDRHEQFGQAIATIERQAEMIAARDETIASRAKVDLSGLEAVGLCVQNKSYVDELVAKAKAYDHLCTRLIEAPAISPLVTTTLATVRKLARGLMSYSGDFYTRKETMVELIDNLIGAEAPANDDTAALVAAQ